jgi:signal transduction histidine kinase
VRERFGDLLADGVIWMLPAVHAGRVVGGVLFAAPAELVARLRSYPDELEALSGAFGLAIETAVVRAGSEVLLEELADVNRRLHAAQEELLRTKSLSMIAAMAAGAAHELNNPLAVISGRAQMLAAQAQDDQQQRAMAAIHEHAQRASDIVSELLDFAKPDPPRVELISLLPWFEQFRARWLADSSLGPEQFHLAIADPALTTRADPDQLTRIFDALLANATEATTPENARLVVNSASRASDDTVVVSVEDNGCGMAAEVLDHALDPFFSHRPAGRGRGLGLSQAHSLAVSNGGRLWLESTPGVGTTAFVELPAARTA